MSCTKGEYKINSNNKKISKAFEKIISKYYEYAEEGFFNTYGICNEPFMEIHKEIIRELINNMSKNESPFLIEIEFREIEDIDTVMTIENKFIIKYDRKLKYTFIPGKIIETTLDNMFEYGFDNEANDIENGIY